MTGSPRTFVQQKLLDELDADTFKQGGLVRENILNGLQ